MAPNKPQLLHLPPSRSAPPSFVVRFFPYMYLHTPIFMRKDVMQAGGTEGGKEEGKKKPLNHHGPLRIAGEETS